MNLIITDIESRKSFDIFNICKHHKIQTVQLYSGGVLRFPLLALAYNGNTLRCGNLNLIESLLSIVNQSSDEEFVFFPIEEESVIKIYTLQDKKPDNLYFSLPPKESFDLVRNKGKFSNYCTEHGFPVPKEYKYSELVGREKIPHKLIIKPKIGAGSVGIKYVSTMKELREYKALDFNKYIIQDRIGVSNSVEAAFFLCQEGEVISYYGHRRIRTSPPEGGVTVFSCCAVNEELRGIGGSLLKKLNWSGIAMIEFIFDHELDSYKVIEVNPRAWGSILLSEYCGADFVRNYIKLSLGEDLSRSSINQSTCIRWFFPWDLLSYIRSGFRIENFWLFSTHNTCFINFTYSSIFRSISFFIYQISSFKSIKKFINRVFN